ncbi:hypothetical protein OROGR_018562 [Orobanche gracilis]
MDESNPFLTFDERTPLSTAELNALDNEHTKYMEEAAFCKAAEEEAVSSEKTPRVGTAENPIEPEPEASVAPVTRKGAILQWKPPVRTRKRKKATPPHRKVNSQRQPTATIQPQQGHQASEPTTPLPSQTGTSAIVKELDLEIQELVRKRSSWVWEHFELVKEKGEIVAYCMYCRRIYMAKSKNGTSNMKCNIFIGMSVDKTQPTISFAKKEVSAGYSYENSRSKLIRMIIIDELPFVVVEYEGFIAFVHSLNHRFSLPSRVTVSRDCMKL